MPDFKIGAAQVASVRGDIDGNIATHAAAMAAAAGQGVSVLVFPELSLTGYEPDLASELAMTAEDKRLDRLRALARQHQLEAIVGAPLQNGAGKPALGALLIGSNGMTRIYRKIHLGGSEPTFFDPGDRPQMLTVLGNRVGVAICADSSQPAHPQTYAESGANIYAAGVFLTAEWYETDVPRLANYARCYTMLTVMANHAASIGRYVSVGRSAIWRPDGTLLVQAEGTDSALLIAANSSGEWHGQLVAL